MDTQFFKDHWTAVKTVLKEMYPALTENDLAYVFGREGDVIDRVRSRTGLKREEVEQVVQDRIKAA
jgi:hypothetical protein